MPHHGDFRSDSDRIVAIETILNQMNKQLFGNGQPGMLTVMQQKTEEVKARVVEVERKQAAEENQMIGKRATLAAIVGLVVFLIDFVTGSGVVSLKSLTK